MHAAQVVEFGQPPQWVEVPDIPVPAEGQVQVKVLTAGLSNIARMRASGKHYSAKSLPHTLGVDGTGEYLTGPNKGKKCLFNALNLGYSFQERINIAEEDVTPLPEGLDPSYAIGWLNPAASSWLAVRLRTRMLPKDFTVVILGATTASGQIAADLTRQSGAKKVIGIARNEQKLKELKLDNYAILKDNPAETQWGDLSGVDLVLDYIYGPAALELLKALPGGHYTQYITIGALAGPEIALPSMVLRSKDITIVGSGIGSWDRQEMSRELPGLVEAMSKIPPREVRAEKIQDITKLWNEKDSRRWVYVFDQ